MKPNFAIFIVCNVCLLDKPQTILTSLYFLQGRYGTVKQCKRISDKKLFAVKEVRSQISDDFDKACLENLILTRLNLAKNSNIVHQEAFYKDLGKQTTHLVMEALNGMTLLETLQDESSCDQENLDEYLLGPQK